MPERRITELTSSAAVLAALEEFDTLGRNEFLKKYGFGRAREYFLVHEGRRYDSKAIAGVAFGNQHKTRSLQSGEFSGGERTVERQLNGLGFRVERHSR